MLSSKHDLSFPLPLQTHLLVFLSNQPTTWKGAHVFSSDAPLPLFPPTSWSLISFPSIYLRSPSSSPPTTPDPFLPPLCPPLIPLFHTTPCCDPCAPRAVMSQCELLVQEPACVVALGQRWHRPAGMRGNRVWAFLHKRTIKPTAVHNELILIQLRCTFCILAFRSLFFPFIIDYTVYLCFWPRLFICSPSCSTCCGLICISLADCMQY